MRRGRRGFTLVEMLVALVVGSTLMLGVASATMRLGRLQQRSSAVAYQTSMLRHWVERFSAMPYDSLLNEPREPADLSSPWPGPGTLTIRRRIRNLASVEGREVLVIVSVPGITPPDTISIERVPLVPVRF